LLNRKEGESLTKLSLLLLTDKERPEETVIGGAITCLAG